jgi:hypothetical protein
MLFILIQILRMFFCFQATYELDLSLHVMSYMQVFGSTLPQLIPFFAALQSSSHVILCNQLRHMQVNDAINFPLREKYKY